MSNPEDNNPESQEVQSTTSPPEPTTKPETSENSDLVEIADSTKTEAKETINLDEIRIKEHLSKLENPYSGKNPIDYKAILRSAPIIIIAEDNDMLRDMNARFLNRLARVDVEKIKVFRSAEQLLDYLRIEPNSYNAEQIPEKFPPIQSGESYEDYLKFLESLAGGIIMSDNDMGYNNITGAELADKIYQLRKNLGMTFAIHSGDAPYQFEQQETVDAVMTKPTGFDKVPLRKLAKAIVKNAEDFWRNDE